MAQRRCMHRQCSRKATMAGENNDSFGAWYFCTQHMKQRRNKGSFQWVWVIEGNSTGTEAQRRLVLS